MFQPTWQKSSFSTGGEGECVELASGLTGQVHLRESDRPAQVATATPVALEQLFAAIRRGGLEEA